MDLGSCFLIADLARRAVSPRTANAAFVLAALCPFLADYAAAVLTETLEIFFTVLALDYLRNFAGFAAPGTQADRPLGAPWLGCGASVGRRDLAAPGRRGCCWWRLHSACFCFYSAASLDETRGPGRLAVQPSPVVRAGTAGRLLLSLAPLVPWTLRNLHTLHQFQPLAPRYASGSSEFVPMGFNRWVKTWMADYVSVEEIYWSVFRAGSDRRRRTFRSRAFDSPEQRTSRPSASARGIL